MKKILFIILMLVSINTFGQKKNILFEINKWEIRPSEELKLKEIINEYNYQKDTIHVDGYADKVTGTRKRNMFLSQKRAETVKDYLVKHGIDSTMIKVRNYGDTVFSFNTPEENRVEIYF